METAAEILTLEGRREGQGGDYSNTQNIGCACVYVCV